MALPAATCCDHAHDKDDCNPVDKDYSQRMRVLEGKEVKQLSGPNKSWKCNDINLINP